MLAKKASTVKMLDEQSRPMFGENGPSFKGYISEIRNLALVYMFKTPYLPERSISGHVSKMDKYPTDNFPRSCDIRVGNTVVSPHPPSLCD